MAELNQGLFNDGNKLYEMDPSLDWSKANVETEDKVVSGYAIQLYIKLLKADADKKIGYFAVSDKANVAGKVVPHLFGFKNKKDYDTWIGAEGTKPDALVLVSVELPLTERKTTDYVNKLETYTSTDIVSSNGQIKIDCMFTSQSYDPGQTVPNKHKEQGELVIEKYDPSNSDKPWSAIKAVDNRGNVIKYVNSWERFTMDLTDELSGRTEIRVYVKGNPEFSKVNTNIIYYNTNKTTLKLEDNTQWFKAQKNKIALNYKVFGNVDKVLKIKISGVGPGGYRIEEKNVELKDGVVVPVDIIDSDIIINPVKVITQGIHTVEAWLEVKGKDIESNHVFTEILVNKDETDQRTYILVKNIAEKISNWEPCVFFEYSVFNNNGQNLNLDFDWTDPDNRTKYLTQSINNIKQETVYKFENKLQILNNNEDIIASKLDIKEGDSLIKQMLLEINNTGGFSPTAGADFILSTTSRDNNKSDREKIFNSALLPTDKKYEVAAEWHNVNFNNIDGWISDENNNKCLRLLKGQFLNIKYNPFAGWDKGGDDNKSCTIEMYVATRNITDIEASVLRMFEANYNIINDFKETDTFNGFKLRTLDGYYLTEGLSGEVVLSQDIAFLENEMTHIAINIRHDFIECINNESGQLIKSNLVRIFINGIINREFQYTDKNGLGDPMDSLSRIISVGSLGADIDLYELKVYKKPLSSAEIFQNYVSVIPSNETKKQVKEMSDILENGRISYNKVKDKYNTLLWTYHPGCNAGTDLAGFTRPAGKEFGDKEKSDRKEGDLIIRIINDGKLDLKHSGIMANIKTGGQGTSSMNYWKWNQRWQIDNKTTPYAIFRNDLGEFWGGGADKKGKIDEHSFDSITPGVPGNHIDELSKYVTVIPSDQLKNKNGKDGQDGKIRYQMFDNEPFIIKKFDGKINWASPQQSHKLGSTSLYHDIWEAVVNKSAIRDLQDQWVNTDTNELITDPKLIDKTPHKAQLFAEDGRKFTGTDDGYKSCRMTVHQKPFFLFILPGKAGDKLPNSPGMAEAFGEYAPEEPVFWGLYTVGSGKGDKPTFGEDGDHWPEYIMMEGCDNSAPLVNHRVPWNRFDVTCPPDGDQEQGIYFYNSAKNWEISSGSRVEEWAEEGITDPDNLPTDTLKFFKEMCNFVYKLNPNIHGYLGTYEQLCRLPVKGDKDVISPDQVEGRDYIKATKLDFYWCSESSEGHNKYNLYRYDEDGTKSKSDSSNYIPGWSPQWVDAGIEYADHSVNKYEPLNLLDQLKELWGIQDDPSDVKLNAKLKEYNFAILSLDEKNEFFKQRRLDLFKGNDTDPDSGIKKYFEIDDLLYTLQYLKLIAASDNWAKNAYLYTPGKLYWTDSLGESHVESKIHKFRFFQDDLDTIFFTDNSGKRLKPYYVEEFDMQSAGNPYWPSNKNGLYKSTIFAYETECRSTMNRILSAMNQKAGGVFECFDKYYFHIQNYFPAVAYNEIAKLLYEDAFKHKMIGDYSYSEPLAQCLGDQLQSEKQWLKQRSVYMSSYASYGDFGAKDTMGGNDVLGFKSYGESPEYQFDLTPYIWLYPSIGVGTSDKYPESSPYSKRFMAKQPAHFDTFSSGNDTFIAIRGLNEYTDIGNFNNVSVNPSAPFTISGKRLESFKVVGTEHTPIVFTPASLTLSAPNIKDLNISGTVKKSRNVISQELELSGLKKIENIDITATSTPRVILPENSNIKKLHLPKTIQNVVLDSQSKLTDFDAVSYTNIKELVIKDTFKQVPENIYIIFNKCFDQKAKLNRLEINNVNWTNVTIDQLEYICNIEHCKLVGRIQLGENQKLSSKLKIKLLNKFGPIDDETNEIYIKYKVYPVADVKIGGYSHVYYDDNESHNCEYSCITNEGSNNIIDITWSLTNNEFATIDSKTGVLKFTKPEGYNGQEKHQAEMTCVVKTTDPDIPGKYLTKSVNKTIYFYTKVAEPGDYVYYDGTYSSQTDIIDKSIIGVCIYINPLDPKDRRMIGVNNINDLILNKEGENIWDTTKYGKLYLRWGVDEAKLPDLKQMASNIESIYDIKDLDNREVNLADGVQDNAILDEEGNFKYYNPKDKTNAMSDSNGYENTQTIIKHRDALLKDIHERVPGTDSIYNDFTSADYETMPFKNKFEHITELISKKVGYDWVKSELVSAEPDSIWSACCLYPAASYCNAYEPALQTSENLNPKFKEGNWYLPSFYELALINWYYGKLNSPDDVYNIFKQPIKNKVITDFAMKDETAWTEPYKYLCSTERNSTYTHSIYFRKLANSQTYKHGTVLSNTYKAGSSEETGTAKYCVRPMVKF